MGKNKRDPIPESFNNIEEAGEFWDTHSAVDYWDEMEEVEMEFEIRINEQKPRQKIEGAVLYIQSRAPQLD